MPVFGVMRGIIASSTVPSAKGKVRVSLPAANVSGSLVADVCSPPGGLAVYPVGSTVVVAFENGDIQRPIVLGRVS